MARNKHPEETVNLILEVAFRLFMEKGYEHTSIQDIIEHLGGLSKGLMLATGLLYIAFIMFSYGP